MIPVANPIQNTASRSTTGWKRNAPIKCQNHQNQNQSHKESKIQHFKELPDTPELWCQQPKGNQEEKGRDDLPSSWPSCQLCLNADAVATFYLAGLHRLFLEAKLAEKDHQTALQEANARAYKMETICLEPLARHLHQLFHTVDDLFFDVYPEEFDFWLRKGLSLYKLWDFLPLLSLLTFRWRRLYVPWSQHVEEKKKTRGVEATSTIGLWQLSLMQDTPIYRQKYGQGEPPQKTIEGVLHLQPRLHAPVDSLLHVYVDGGCQELLWQPQWGTTAKSFRASERCLAVLRGLELQHNCNITATRTATQPRNAVIYRVNLPCSMFKGFEPLRKRPCLGKVKNADCVVKNSVAWLCCSSCCSYVAVVLQ